jgi:type I restriction enzyme S subunit
MKWRAYPAYKESGVEWLGEVPEHWHATRIKWVARMESGHTPDKKVPEYWENCDIPWVSLNDTTQLRQNDYIQDTLHRINALGVANSSARVLPAGAVVFSRDATVGLCGITARPMAVSQHFIAWLCHDGIIPEFLLRVLRSMGGELERRTMGATVKTIGMPDVKTLVAPIPPVAEQRAICGVLASEISKIDTLISKQELLIELLQEKRQAHISHAVTKGLNPDAPMKPSGVEWLGKVPEHWTVTRVKWLFRTTSGGTPETSRRDLYYDGPIPWIRSLDLNNGEIEQFELGITEAALKATACKILPRGSVLVAMYGGDGTIGKNGVLRIEAAVNQAVCAILPSPALAPDFLILLIQHLRPFWMVAAEGARKDPNISQEIIRSATVLQPSKEEQAAIVEHVRVEGSLIDRLTAKAEAAIALMRERRAALISAAVTGKIDVRDVQQSSHA